MQRLTLSVAALTMLVCLFLVSPAGAQGRRTIRVVERATTDATTDTGAPGDSAGDILTFANAVYNRTNTTKVGSDQGFCVRVVPGAAYECTWTTLLAGGQIVVQGPFYDTKDSTLAITGGTGRFSRVRGQMRLHARPDAKSYDFIFRLR